MKIILNHVVLLLITVLINFSLNWGASYLALNKGSVVLSDPVKIQQDIYVPIDINNFTNGSLDDFEIIIPNNVAIGDIIFSEPVLVEIDNKNVGLETKQYLLLSGIPPKTSTKVLLPIKDIDAAKIIAFPNCEAKQVLLETQSFENPKIRIIKYAFYHTILYTIPLIVVYGILAMYNFNRYNESAKEMKNITKRLEDSDKTANEIRHSCVKCKTILLARINDYSKENTFWKDTIRSILYTVTKDKLSAEKIFKIVTNSLRTYSIANSSSEKNFEAIKYLSELIVKADLANNNSTQS